MNIIEDPALQMVATQVGHAIALNIIDFVAPANRRHVTEETIEFLLSMQDYGLVSKARYAQMLHELECYRALALRLPAFETAPGNVIDIREAPKCR